MSGTPSVFDLVPAVVLAGAGVFMLFRAKESQAAAHAEHQARLTDRLQRGSDSYFEELRDIQSYRPIQTLARRRWAGAALLIFALAYLGLYLIVSE